MPTAPTMTINIIAQIKTARAIFIFLGNSNLSLAPHSGHFLSSPVVGLIQPIDNIFALWLKEMQSSPQAGHLSFLDDLLFKLIINISLTYPLLLQIVYIPFIYVSIYRNIYTCWSIRITDYW